MFKVFFKGKNGLPSVCVFNAAHLEIAVEAALALHRMSNVPHEIDVVEERTPEEVRGPRLHLEADFEKKDFEAKR